MMMIQEKRSQPAINTNPQPACREADCIYALITRKRSVSRRNRASWFLKQLNKLVKCDHIDDSIEEEEEENNHDPDILLDDSQAADNEAHAFAPDQLETRDIRLVSVTTTTDSSHENSEHDFNITDGQQQFLVTPKTRVLFLSRSVATSIVLDLSPSVVSVSAQNDCVFLDSLFDALKRVLYLLVKTNETPSSSETKPFILRPKVFVSVIAYTPFVAAKNNQVLVQNRRISAANIDQVLAEIFICLNRLTQEIHELVGSTCGMNLDFSSTRTGGNVFIFPHPTSGSVIRHPGAVLEDIYELGLFSSSLMPKMSRLSVIVISDGLFSSSNNLNIFRLKSVALSFVSLGSEAAYPDSCFGYAPYIDLMKFVARTTLGVYLSYQDLINSSQSLNTSKRILLLDNPLHKLFTWNLHSDIGEDLSSSTPKATNFCKFETLDDTSESFEVKPEHVTRFFCVDQPVGTSFISGGNNYKTNYNYHDWRSFKQLERNLDADFEQVLACLLREGYLIKSIQFKHKEQSRIVVRLILHWRHNLDLEQELSAPYWNNTVDMNDNSQLILRPFNTPLYGDTFCEIIVHGSYSFLHNLYCDRKASKRRSEFRDIAYRQFRQLIDGVLQTHERLQYLSRFYRDSSLSKVPSFLLHGNSLLYEQPHTHRLTSTIENVSEESKTTEFQEYWQKISCLDTKSWKNLLHQHTIRLVLEHDQPKHKNIHCQNANGRYSHIQCLKAMSAVSTFIKSYSSFALLEDTTYIKFIYNKDDDLRDIETSATKGFIVIRINKLLPIIVIYLMFTSGILDSHRAQIVSYLENQLVNCKIRNVRNSSAIQMNNILKTKTISPCGESCCALIRSPLERMLKVYSRNFISDFLVHNLAHGLPGSCPYTLQQSLDIGPSSASSAGNDGNQQQHQHASRSRSDTKERDGHQTSDSSIYRYNLVFGKYLYGVRTVQTITSLPTDLLSSISSNVLSKISAILVNLRIKQGYHIAFNNSGILNLVVELSMKDHSNDDNNASGCLCQYIVFPPIVTNNQHQAVHSALNAQSTSNCNASGVSQVKAGSLTGSLANSDSYLKNGQDLSTNPHMRSDNSGEIKIIREYWIEQQYGISSEPRNGSYHKSLQNMRYSEVVDHLFTTDKSIFECLLTYNFLLLLCDKLSLYYDLDTSFTHAELKRSPIVSPTYSISSTNQLQHRSYSPTSPKLPSTLIDGSTKDGNSRVPLLEMDYKFSVTSFLDHCQLASLNVLLFKSRSEFYDPLVVQANDEPGMRQSCCMDDSVDASTSNSLGTSRLPSRKMSVDVNELERNHIKREHRSSYQHDNHSTQNTQTSSSTQAYVNPIYSSSLNHLFLETLHKRLRQLHDKELKLSDHDRQELHVYLKRRRMLSENANGEKTHSKNPNKFNSSNYEDVSDGDDLLDNFVQNDIDCGMDWRCFLRKGNQENLMIVIVPANLTSVNNWLRYTNEPAHHTNSKQNFDSDPICPIFVFRCSSTMINDHVLAFLDEDNKHQTLESDLALHFGQPLKYMGELKVFNDELSNDILPLAHCGALNQTTSDEKTLEVVHFRAFLRKIKNTVLKSRFSSFNDAYLSELFIHKDDILYYIDNVDLDTQKKYHVSLQLKSVADFIKSYEEYNNSLPTEPSKSCNPLLNSILLQKCGLFINQPISRYNDANPLMKQLHDKKLLYLIRCNYKVELPILEENLANSELLKKFIEPSCNNFQTSNHMTTSHRRSTTNHSNEARSSIISHTGATPSSLSKSEGTRFMEMRHYTGSVDAAAVGSPFANYASNERQPIKHHHLSHSSRYESNSTLNSLPNSANDSFILEAFRGSKTCSIKEVSMSILDDISKHDISLRHEAHMAEVLRRTGEKKESHHYRRVLKSRANYNQSYGAIDQALKRVDSLGRLEHFCLTPLLFSPSWRSQLAPVRDHTIGVTSQQRPSTSDGSTSKLESSCNADATSESSTEVGSQTAQRLQLLQEAEDRWHQMVCNNYIKEYEQYIQTLGFNSVQIRYQTNSKGVTSKSLSSTNPKSSTSSRRHSQKVASINLQSSGNNPNHNINSYGPTKITSSNKLRKESISNSNASLQASSSTGTTTAATCNTGYLIKFLNSGCLVFKVGFCKPYVYSILYSIEGERFNNSNTKVNMAAFVDELDNIKVTMHLHSFTYDYHLRSIYSYISGRQMTFSPGYHLISFLDDFRKYYQKAPNYARNHILCGEVSISSIKVTGQQLYNYIVTHNSAYNMEVLEMASSVYYPQDADLLTSSRKLIEDYSHDSSTSSGREANRDSDPSITTRGHANDYVLIELKREKVRYRDGKGPDVFDCGLLISHDAQQSNSTKNCLTLKYFLLLTNQRDLYPRLIHTYDNIITLGCHRPIRLGLIDTKPQQQLQRQNQQQPPVHKTSMTTAPSSGLSDPEDLQSSELQSSGEMSGPQSILSTANSNQSSNSGLQFVGLHTAIDQKNTSQQQTTDRSSISSSQAATTTTTLPKFKVDESEEIAYTTLRSSIDGSVTSIERCQGPASVLGADLQELGCNNKNLASSVEDGNSFVGETSPRPTRRNRNISTSSSTNNNANAKKTFNNHERTICDEEITYLGYFSSDEMDMLKFLQEKTVNLRFHIEQVVRQAEVHYRRDYLWHKLMQRTVATQTKSDELPLSVDELVQLLDIVELLDLASLDPQLTMFTNLHINWYLKLLKAFADLKQSSTNQHRIFSVKAASRFLLLFIDPKCTTAFILLTIDPERCSIELNMLLKDKHDCGNVSNKSPTKQHQQQPKQTTQGFSSQQQQSADSIAIELDQECQQLINDFINFCATFMWSTFLM